MASEGTTAAADRSASRVAAAPADATSPTDVAARVVQRGKGGLELLLEARLFAADLDRDLWDFALEIETLRRHGLTHSDLRWLVCKGYLKQSREILCGSGQARTFQQDGTLTFTETSCFILTEAGVDLVKRFAPIALGPLTAPALTNHSAGLHALYCEAAPPTGPPTVDGVPHWDRDRQELRIGRYVVKRFKVPAPNQEVILAVFDEEGWPPRIDDPLPPRADLDSKRRLHDTINSLNRNQKTPLVRFLGDGTGQGVRWEFSAGGVDWSKGRQRE